jgi:tRNA A-37 threonylcarbamoyl transferase component Bud32
MHEAVEFAGRVLGRCAVVQDCTWEHRMSRVLRLRDRHGAEWFVKQHRDQNRYAAEVMAYRRWVPALGSQAPRLRSCDDELHAIIISAVPGTLAPWPAPAARALLDRRRADELIIQRQAGAALQRLHRAEPPLRWPDFGLAKIGELDQLMPQAAGLLTGAKLGFARTQVRAMTAITTAVKVPCHRDYTPRNWLIHDGTLSVIDYEWARLDAPASDLARLHIGAWTGRPDLAEAFLDGYGRQLGDADHAILRGCAVITAIWLIIKARETAQPVFEQASKAALDQLISQR